MTAQASELLRYEGQDCSMMTLPLSDYFAMGGRSPDFTAPHTALWRGYIGSWEIKNDRLYLVAFRGHLADGVTATLESLFPGFPDRVFAHWYSGTLRIPQGRQVEYMHMGFGSRYETEVYLKVQKGVVVGKKVQHHAPEPEQ
jgi:hypothetical protein